MVGHFCGDIEVVVIVDVSEEYESTFETVRVLVGRTLIIAGKIVDNTVATDGGGAALAGCVSEFIALVAKSRGIVVTIKVQASRVFVNSLFG